MQHHPEVVVVFAVKPSSWKIKEAQLKTVSHGSNYQEKTIETLKYQVVSSKKDIYIFPSHFKIAVAQFMISKYKINET